MRMTENEKMLLEVAQNLPSDLLNQVVFLGGAVVGLLVTDEGMGPPRPTLDVDLVIDTTSRTDFHTFERKLRKSGFSPSMERGDPICRWRIGSVKIDIMPCNEAILGFSNKWYKAAIENFQVKLLATFQIRIVTAPYFLATKIEAFLGRGNNDFLGSPDMEDIVTLFDGRKELVEEIRNSQKDLQEYLGNIFHQWFQRKEFLSCLAGHTTAGAANADRAEEVKRRILAIAKKIPGRVSSNLVPRPRRA